MNELLKIVCFSPRRLAVAAVAAVTGFGLGAFLLLSTGEGPTPVAHRPTLPPVLTDTAAIAVARAFVDARFVLQPGQTPGQWLEVVAGLSTPGLIGGLSRVDPTRLPQTRVYGLPGVRTISATSAQVAVKIVGSDIVLVEVVMFEGRPLVSDARAELAPTTVVDW